MIITIIFLGEIQFFLNPKIWSNLRVVIHFDKIFDIVVAGIVASAPRLLGFSEVALYYGGYSYV